MKKSAAIGGPSVAWSSPPPPSTTSTATFSGCSSKPSRTTACSAAIKAAQELNYSTVVICFQIAYAVGMLLAGRIIDKVGTKKGYAYSLIGWSFAAIGHAFGHHTWSFGFWRAALGLSEAGNFPGGQQDHRRVVSQKGARVRHRPL